MSSNPSFTATEHFNKIADKYEDTTGGGTRELAEHAISLIAGRKALTSESVILDNACGTGIVSDIIVQSGIQPEIHAVDSAANMINITRSRFSSHPNIHAAVMPGEALCFPDDTFTHSITNLGLMFFNDADRGAREIARTLHPDGVAVVTGWAMMGHIDIIRDAQAQVRADDTPVKLPVSDIWLDAEHTKAVLSGAGLTLQAITAVDVHLGSKTMNEIADILTQTFGSRVCESWNEEEKERFAGAVKKIVAERAVSFTRPSGSGVGIRLTGTIFVARKGLSRVTAV